LALNETSKPQRIATQKAATALTIGDPLICSNSKPLQNDRKSLADKQAPSDGSVLAD
jgi:hypothetical protein